MLTLIFCFNGEFIQVLTFGIIKHIFEFLTVFFTFWWRYKLLFFKWQTHFFIVNYHAISGWLSEKTFVLRYQNSIIMSSLQSFWKTEVCIITEALSWSGTDNLRYSKYSVRLYSKSQNHNYFYIYSCFIIKMGVSKFKKSPCIQIIILYHQ